jgi:hypothetical protein
LTVRPPHNYPKSWQDEDTILGDFLRASKKFAGARVRGNSTDEASTTPSGGDRLDLMPFTEEHSDLSSTASSLLGDVPADQREAILADATLLGVELLRGGKPSWGRKS